ncbi:hypothetical protein ALO43_200379 [Pseudomonas tremae]|uniref:Uncharacterized protein n=1 Tax=Pseudomonas tremae TaxID=200454 RepID=A0AA40NZ83_9PSED|nr:hypothetical protein ALO43_200379 [Pseudomonas tremae]
MRKDLQMPIILAITDCQTDLHVISFTGRDALNEAYRFDIWLIGALFWMCAACCTEKRF